MKRLFDDKYEAMTPEAKEFSRKLDRSVKALVDELGEEYSLRDIQSLIILSLSALISERIIKRAIDLKRKERHDEYIKKSLGDTSSNSKE